MASALSELVVLTDVASVPCTSAAACGEGVPFGLRLTTCSTLSPESALVVVVTALLVRGMIDNGESASAFAPLAGSVFCAAEPGLCRELVALLNTHGANESVEWPNRPSSKAADPALCQDVPEYSISA